MDDREGPDNWDWEAKIGKVQSNDGVGNRVGNRSLRGWYFW